MSEECKCPKCGYPMYCGCQACAPGVPPSIVPYRWTEDGENVVCGGCGFTASEDFWFDEGVRQMKAQMFRDVGIDIIK